MSNLFEIILAAGPGEPDAGAWIQILIIAIVFISYAVKIFTSAKDSLYNDDQNDDSGSGRSRPRRSDKLNYGKDSEYKSLSELMAEKSAQVRAAHARAQQKRNQAMARQRAEQQSAQKESPRQNKSGYYQSPAQAPKPSERGYSISAQQSSAARRYHRRQEAKSAAAKRAQKHSAQQTSPAARQQGPEPAIADSQIARTQIGSSASPGKAAAGQNKIYAGRDKIVNSRGKIVDSRSGVYAGQSKIYDSKIGIDTPAQLKKAVIFAEILEKPMALRPEGRFGW